jgi:thioredoxin-dependent peroxiredoxin
MKYRLTVSTPMVEVGEPAPDFEGVAATGGSVSLHQFRGRPIVLYFYPKASSMGCSIEAREFAAHYSEFERRGVGLVGVSVDSIDAQKRFSDHCRLPFPLIADRSKAIARSYGVLGVLGMAKRVTFFIGADGRIEEVVSGLRPQPHVRRALERIGSSSAPVSGPPSAGPP